MARFILRYSGAAAPPEDFTLAAAAPNIRLLDQSPKMILLEAEPADAEQLNSRLPGWALYPQKDYRIPDGRKHIGDENG